MFDASDKSLIMPGYGPTTTVRKILQYEAIGLSSLVNTDTTAPNGFRLAPLSNQSATPINLPIGVLVDEIPSGVSIAAGEREFVYNFVFFGRAKVRLASDSTPVFAGYYVKPWNTGNCAKAAVGELSLGRALSNGVAGDLIDIFINPSLALY